MNYIIFENSIDRNNLLPLTYTRPIAALRIGILTIKEKWDKQLDTNCTYLTADYLQAKFPLITKETNTYINGSICPTLELSKAIKSLTDKSFLCLDDELIAYTSDAPISDFSNWNKIQFEGSVLAVKNPWDIFSKNGEAIRFDFDLITKGRKSGSLSNTNTIIGDGEIFIEEGAKAECATFNTNSGPIYIGKNTEIMEGSLIRSPFVLCENSTLKLGSKIYGPTTIGPHSKVGGEVNNCVIQGYSNKGHDGFLGNSVIGEWCNIGADSNNSNLKNNYADVKLWNYPAGRFINTELQFCGLIMGDHSKCGINTMFNTGTVIGVSANIFGSGFPRNFVPSFSWGGAQGFTTYATRKAFEVAQKVFERRNLEFDEIEKSILEKVFEISSQYRKD
ncbi:MAG: UDP-N-acetylglucosamine diphosphorylase/glucosamine-1-phosphate N-acetyltransferase [Flavobacteriales bacterium]|jgi:UDP-N-acetylglucosamine diphosphorylase/glucosamine-1-phosphate N-acetyltransferase